MSRVNICLQQLGAQIIEYSSTSDQQLCQPSNVLVDKHDCIWNSGQGLPQYLTISLEKVNYQYSYIAAVGFYCWHDYETNPQTIEIEVAQSPHSKFVLWSEVKLELQNGKQFFDIQHLPPRFKIIKINITQTFGDFETYLNQVMLMAQNMDDKHRSQMSVNELDLEFHQPKMHPVTGMSKTQKNFKSAKNKKAPFRKLQTQEVKNESDSQYQDNAFHHKQIYSMSNSKKELEPERQPSYEQAQEKDSSFNNGVALLALSQKALAMEEDIQIVKRQLQVLDLKVSYSFQNLENHIMANVQKLVQHKLKQFKKQLKNEFKNESRQRTDLRQIRSQKDPRQFKSSRQFNDDLHEYQMYRGVTSRQQPKSLHINNLNQSAKQKQVPTKDNLISDLMSQLSNKLKQREMKVKKMEHHSKEPKMSKRNHHQFYS